MEKATSHKLGPGLLTFGETGSGTEFGGQCTKISIEPKVKTDDSIPVLSGDQVAGDDKLEWSLSGTILDRYDKRALQVWAHQYRGEFMPFLFRPDADKDLAIKGQVKIQPIAIGGDVKSRNQNDFEFTGAPEIYEFVDATSEEHLTWDAAAPEAASDGDW